MAIKYPDILKSNNPKTFGIVEAKEIAGHRRVSTKEELYSLAAPILSEEYRIVEETDSEGNKTSVEYGTEAAIGQVWFVSNEGKHYKLVNWGNRDNESGWEVFGESSNTADKLTTARKIGITGGIVGTATDFDGSGDINIPVTTLYEAYMSYGGKAIAGDVSPIDGTAVSELWCNKFAYYNPDYINVEYTNNYSEDADGNESSDVIWTEYPYTNTNNRLDKLFALVTGGLGNFYSSGSSSNSTAIAGKTRLRVTFNTYSARYIAPKKLLIRVSASAQKLNNQIKVEVVSKTDYDAGNTDKFTHYSTNVVSGDAGWNSMSFASSFGNATNAVIKKLRITFIVNGVDTTNRPPALHNIYMIGKHHIINDDNLAASGHFYKYDYRKNMEVPAALAPMTSKTQDIGYASRPWKNVYAQKYITDGGTSEQVLLGDGTLKALSEITTNYTLPPAGVELGGVKNGGNVVVDSEGQMNVSDVTMTTSGLMSPDDKSKLDSIDLEELDGEYIGLKISQDVDDAELSVQSSENNSSASMYVDSTGTNVSAKYEDGTTSNHVIISATSEGSFCRGGESNQFELSAPTDGYPTLSLSKDGTSFIYANEEGITAPKFITKDGTSEQVVLGDGSLKALSEIGGSGGSSEIPIATDSLIGGIKSGKDILVDSVSGEVSVIGMDVSDSTTNYATNIKISSTVEEDENGSLLSSPGISMVKSLTGEDIGAANGNVVDLKSDLSPDFFSTSGNAIMNSGYGVVSTLNYGVSIDSRISLEEAGAPSPEIIARYYQKIEATESGIEQVLADNSSSIYSTLDSGGVKVNLKKQPIGQDKVHAVDLFLGYNSLVPGEEVGNLSIVDSTNNSSFNVTVGDDTNTLLKLSKDDNFVEITPTQITAPKFITKDGTSEQVVLGDGTLKPLSEIGGGSNGDGSYILPAAGTELGGVKSGGDVTISKGVISISEATTKNKGLMSAADKVKLDEFKYSSDYAFTLSKDIHVKNLAPTISLCAGENSDNIIELHVEGEDYSGIYINSDGGFTNSTISNEACIIQQVDYTSKTVKASVGYNPDLSDEALTVGCISGTAHINLFGFILDDEGGSSNGYCGLHASGSENTTLSIDIDDGGADLGLYNHLTNEEVLIVACEPDSYHSDKGTTYILSPKFIKTGGTADEILMADGSVKEVSNLLTDTKVISLNNESEDYGGAVANITLNVEDTFTPNLCVSMNCPSYSTESVKMYLGYDDNISDEELSIGIVANGKASNGVDDECRAAGILADKFTGFKAYTGSREAIIKVGDNDCDSYILLQSNKEEDLVTEQFPDLRHWEDPKGIYIRCRIPEGEGLAEKYGESHIKCPRFITTGGTSEQVVLGDGTLKPLSEIEGSGSSTGGLELGTTETTAFRGDLGQAVYDAIFTINKPVCPNIIKVSDLVIKNYNGEVLENESLSVSNNETSGASITIENGIKLDFSLEYKWVSSDDYKNPKAIDLTAEDGITLPWTTLVNTSNTYSNKVSYSNVSSGKTYKAKTSAPKVGLMVEGSTVKPASGNDFGSGEFKVNITRRRFFGLISNGSEITSSLITGLESELSTGRAKSVTITVPGDKQYVYAFESSLGTPAITNKDGESQADFWPVKKITVTNSYGKAIEYSCYVCGAGSYTNSLVNFK